MIPSLKIQTKSLFHLTLGGYCAIVFLWLSLEIVIHEIFFWEECFYAR